MYFERKSTIWVGANRFFGNDFWTSLFSSSDLLSVKPIFNIRLGLTWLISKPLFPKVLLIFQIGWLVSTRPKNMRKSNWIISPVFQGKNQTSCSNHHHLEIFDTPQTWQRQVDYHHIKQVKQSLKLPSLVMILNKKNNYKEVQSKHGENRVHSILISGS